MRANRLSSGDAVGATEPLLFVWEEARRCVEMQLAPTAVALNDRRTLLEAPIAQHDLLAVSVRDHRISFVGIPSSAGQSSAR